ncbi:MAG: SpoIVB peptidase [Firmicutes bacterium]|nr:SpoIVB peptidase [Bacillota bacterium]
MARRIKILRQIIGITTVVMFLGLVLVPSVRCWFSIPDQVKVGVGDRFQFFDQIPASWLEKIELEWDRVDPGDQGKDVLRYGSFLGLGDQVDLEPGDFNLVLKLYGLIPLKKMSVTVANPMYVIPGGESIGIKISEGGVLVKDYSQVINSSGEAECPAMNKGIKPGDMILEADGVRLTSEWDLAEAVNQAGKEQRAISLVVDRNGKRWETKINPVYCSSHRRFRIGLLVKDNLAGVGTLTFYDPLTRAYGALGHVITDETTSKSPDITRGKVIRAPIQGIEPSRRGRPGEKIGILSEEVGVLGTIENNCQYGIYGRLYQSPMNPIYPKPVAVAWHNQITLGPATMLTVISGEDIQEYSIIIEKVFNDSTGEKGIIVRVTDPRLLEVTGGIIQGMSGSPIMQGGRLVGAVTHVFINDPTRGYGLSAENMIDTVKTMNLRSGGESPGHFLLSFLNQIHKKVPIVKFVIKN